MAAHRAAYGGQARYQHEDYQALVDANPAELEHLGKDILISVTAFFRDPASFEILRPALNSILHAKRPGD